LHGGLRRPKRKWLWVHLCGLLLKRARTCDG